MDAPTQIQRLKLQTVMNEAEYNVAGELFQLNLSTITINRFWAKVIKLEGGGCWEWNAARNNRGYGMVGINYRHYLAHRVSYLINFGGFPQSAKVLHKCDNPKCVRPDHLFLGSMKDNTKDMLDKGRGAVGTRSVKAKATEDDVLQMRILRSNGASVASIARMFGLSGSTVSVALRGLKWKHVGGPIADITPKDHQRKITQDKVDEILKLLHDGVIMPRIASKYGVSISCIMKIKRQSGEFELRKLRRKECPHIEPSSS